MVCVSFEPIIDVCTVDVVGHPVCEEIKTFIVPGFGNFSIQPLLIVTVQFFTQASDIAATVVVTVIKKVGNALNTVSGFIRVVVGLYVVAIVVTAFHIGHNHFKFHTGQGINALGGFVQCPRTHVDFVQLFSFSYGRFEHRQLFSQSTNQAIWAQFLGVPLCICVQQKRIGCATYGTRANILCDGHFKSGIVHFGSSGNVPSAFRHCGLFKQFWMQGTILTHDNASSCVGFIFFGRSCVTRIWRYLLCFALTLMS